MSELVSAIIPTYNRAQYLPRAIQSVIDQDYRPIEVIIIDDGSKDNTDTLIPGLKEKLESAGITTTYIKQPNGGPARARNNGLLLARGKYIACLDSDDMWKPNFASTMVRLLEKYPTAGMVFGGYLCIDSDDKLTGDRPTGLLKPFRVPTTGSKEPTAACCWPRSSRCSSCRSSAFSSRTASRCLPADTPLSRTRYATSADTAANASRAASSTGCAQKRSGSEKISTSSDPSVPWSEASSVIVRAPRRSRRDHTSDERASSTPGANHP